MSWPSAQTFSAPIAYAPHFPVAAPDPSTKRPQSTSVLAGAQPLYTTFSPMSTYIFPPMSDAPLAAPSHSTFPATLLEAYMPLSRIEDDPLDRPPGNSTLDGAFPSWISRTTSAIPKRWSTMDDRDSGLLTRRRSRKLIFPPGLVSDSTRPLPSQSSTDPSPAHLTTPILHQTPISSLGLRPSHDAVDHTALEMAQEGHEMAYAWSPGIVNKLEVLYPRPLPTATSTASSLGNGMLGDEQISFEMMGGEQAFSGKQPVCERGTTVKQWMVDSLTDVHQRSSIPIPSALPYINITPSQKRNPMSNVDYSGPSPRLAQTPRLAQHIAVESSGSSVRYVTNQTSIPPVHMNGELGSRKPFRSTGVSRPTRMTGWTDLDHMPKQTSLPGGRPVVSSINIAFSAAHNVFSGADVTAHDSCLSSAINETSSHSEANPFPHPQAPQIGQDELLLALQAVVASQRDAGNEPGSARSFDEVGSIEDTLAQVWELQMDTYPPRPGQTPWISPQVSAHRDTFAGATSAFGGGDLTAQWQEAAPQVLTSHSSQELADSILYDEGQRLLSTGDSGISPDSISNIGASYKPSVVLEWQLGLHEDGGLNDLGDHPIGSKGEEISTPQSTKRKRSFQTDDQLVVPYVCEYCGRLFSRKHDVNRHLRIHTGERPYPCPSCPQRYARNDGLLRHLQSSKKCMIAAPSRTEFMYSKGEPKRKKIN